MKIGIITFHYARNYGAVLQCYALQKVLLSAGHDVTVIDYRPSSVAGGYKVFDIRRFWGATPAKFLRKTRKELRVIGSRRRRYQAFENFVGSELRLSRTVRGISAMENISRDYDMLIVGSDQVWNTKVTKGIDPIYWGGFKRLDKTGLISYAASMEDGLCHETVDAIQRFLPSFKAISVRENCLANTLDGILKSVGTETVVDPTLLLDASEWNTLAQEPVISEPYLFFYQVRKSEEAYQLAKRLASDKGLKLVVLSAKPELENSLEVQCASPSDFVSLFRHASYVVTTSFHGTVFSLIYGKPFWCVDVNDGKGSRQMDLLTRLGLSDRVISDVSAIKDMDIDWDDVHEKMTDMTEMSFEYLKRCGV